MTRVGKTATPRSRTPPGVTFATASKMALALPGVEAGLSWGTPGFKVKGRFLARLKEDGESLVLRIGFLEREQLMAAAPQVFYITDHYQSYPAVLIRLPKVRKDVLRRVLKEAWSAVAPESLVSEGRSRTPPSASKKRRAR
jgi:hypothetical protein